MARRRMGWNVALGVTVIVGWLVLGAAATAVFMASRAEVEPTSFDDATVASLRAHAGSITSPLTAVGCGRSLGGNAVRVDGELLTNRHLADGVTVTVPSGRVDTAFVARSASAEPPLDLALLGEGGGNGEGRLATADPVPGEPVLLAAWIDGVFVTLVGRVHTYTSGGAYGPDVVMLLEPETQPGFSGGPVLDRSGQVVGLLRATDSTTSLAIAVPASTIGEWRDLAKRPAEAPRCG
ncbi:MAG: trypsin-like peptidase domain-containing protein [Acidimicrobiales bacterium]